MTHLLKRAEFKEKDGFSSSDQYNSSRFNMRQKYITERGTNFNSLRALVIASFT